MPTVTGTKAKLSKRPKCGKPLKLYISHFSATRLALKGSVESVASVEKNTTMSI